MYVKFDFFTSIILHGAMNYLLNKYILIISIINTVNSIRQMSVGGWLDMSERISILLGKIKTVILALIANRSHLATSTHGFGKAITK